MTKPDPASTPSDEVLEPTGTITSVDQAEPEPEEEAAPEPWVWTPERVADWNAYYDLYIVGLVLVLVFVASATRINNSTIWTQLQAGRLIAARSAPVLAEPFLYTRLNQPWTNVSWLFEWTSYQIYSLVAGLDIAEADAYAVSVLTGLNAFIRVLTALALLKIRRSGPGTWWVAIATALGLGVVIGPVGVTLGGVASRASLGPETWGIFFLALELLVLHRAYVIGRPRSLYWLIPLFALWANSDETFSSGLLLLAATVAGESMYASKRNKLDGPAPSMRAGLTTIGLSLLACLANPSFHRVFPAAFGPLIDPITSSDLLTIDQLSVFGKQSGEFFKQLHPKILAYYALLVAVGIGSFVLNAKNFRFGRFLTFAVACVLWGLLYRLQDVFALVWAATIALNGQEWYQDVFGTEPKMGWRWRGWSVGGRLVTLAFVTLALLKGMTGYGNEYMEATFDFGYDPDDFAFEAADFLKSAPIQGQIYNLKLAQGDSLNWRAHPLRRPYLDTRRLTGNSKYIKELETVRKALAEGDTAVWKPILDQHGVSVLMVDLQNQPSTRVSEALATDPAWIPFYDDGDTLMFGRADGGGHTADRDFFEANRLVADNVAFKVDRPVRPFNRPPTPVGWIDRVFQARALAPTQPRVKAAQRWLQREMIAEADGSLAPSLAASLLAIQEAHNALSSKPDDTDAYYVQSLAYRRLGDLEARLLSAAGDPELDAGGFPPSIRLRLQQRMTALRNAILTAPKPPKTEYARETLRNMYFELSGLYQQQGYLDLARDSLAEAIALTPSDELEPAAQETLDGLTEQLEGVRAELEQAELEGQAQPEQIALAAVQNGAVGLAIQELEDAEASGIDLPNIKWRLVDLLCDTGQPDRALPYLDNIGNDPHLTTGPGTDSFRQARVYFLLGDYATASELWSKVSIPPLRATRTQGAIQSSLMLLHGDPMGGTRVAMDVPRQLAQQAEWEYILGLSLLEGGKPREAGPRFQTALKLNPKLGGRAIAEEYLKRIGLEIPSGPKAEDPKVEASAPEAETAKAPAGQPKP
jgi:tetratricopeptide (TPR) repeat protein